jgi:hypothetical protein
MVLTLLLVITKYLIDWQLQQAKLVKNGNVRKISSMYNKDTILLFGYHLVSSCELADGNVQPDKQNGDFPQKKGGRGKVDVPKKVQK